MGTFAWTMAAVLLALAAGAAPTTSASDADVRARNVAFVWSLVGDADPAQPASMHDGRVVRLAEAIDEAAARAGPRDLGAIASGATAPHPLPVGHPSGDVWVMEQGNGGCGSIVTPIVWPTNTVGDPQLWTYAAPVAQLTTTHGSSTLILGWTFKESVLAHDTPGFTATGINDLFCFEYDGQHLAFPFLDGEAHVNLAASAAGSTLAFQQGGALGLDDVFWGDVGVHEIGPGPCSSTAYAPGVPTTMPLHPNFYVYEGGVMELGGNADDLYVFNWNNAAVGEYAPAHWHATGNVGGLCFEAEGKHVGIYAINGVVTAGEGWS